MHTRELSLVRHYAGLARSANYLSITARQLGEGSAAHYWRQKRREHLAAARNIKAAAQ